MQEIYKDIVGYEGLYQVSNLGNVKSLKYGKERILKFTTDRNGYLYVVLYKNNIPKTIKIHRLVAIAFIKNPKNKPQINHINGIKDDNRVENLEWNTNQENTKHAYDNGLKFAIRGEKHYRAKLTSEQVLLIKKDNRLHREIAKDYNVCRQLIGHIKRGVIWANL